MKSIVVQATVGAEPHKVWEFWTKPQHITGWNFASPEWHCPTAENDLRNGGAFKYRMEAKEDKTTCFDLEGKYTNVDPVKRIEYVMADERKVEVKFEKTGDSTLVMETFELEMSHTEEEQRKGWQAILNNFKAYAEAN